MIYYQNSGSTDASAYTTDIASWDDDDIPNNTLDASTTWRNTTGSTKTVHIMAFAYDSSVGGQATLKVTHNASFASYSDHDVHLGSK